LADIALAVNGELDRLLSVPACAEARVLEAMHYATMNGGKRIRPYLVVMSARMFQVASPHAYRVAASLEMLHSYSLVHDDLPAMDNSDLRRGRPTTHRCYDDATAILAGDGLLTKSLALLADPATHPKAEVRCALIAALGAAAGERGMVGGQMIDLMSENATLDLEAITYLQDLKTGAIIRYAAESGAILGERPDAERAALSAYARALGLAFQIVDDVLDAEGDSHLTGKPTGADASAGKATFVSLLGVEGAKAKAKEMGAEAYRQLERFGSQADPLRWMIEYVLTRRS
jgi:farnesyl diphosphate synthase